MDSSTSQRRAQSGSVLLRRPGLHHQRLHSSLGRAPIWPSQTRSHAKPEKGYSSLLSFTVTDINSTVTKLMALGAELDGPIKYEIHGKVAAMRCIDGHMLGLYEAA
eukprot:XP_019080858.1 PREDICTED: uncharacterized protein LOC100854951 isoform X2 [Vitis vinifera]